MKKIFALALVLIMIFALVGCDKNDRKIVEVTLSTEDSEAILAAAGIRLPDASSILASGTTVKWFAWYDNFHNYDEDEIVNTGYFTFKEKYGCDVEWIETTYSERNGDLANLILSGNSPDFAPAGHGVTATYPMSCIKGIYVSVDEYIDYTAPLWSGIADAANNFVLGGEHYAILTDVKMQNVCLYNRRVLEEFGFEDPAELYFNDEWTWDVFYEMCLDFSDPDEDRYALDGFAFPGGIVESTGQMLVQRDDNGYFYSNIDSPEIERAQNLLYDIVKNELCYSKGGWSIRSTPGIKDGLCLFYIIGTDAFTDTVENVSNEWGDILNNELMFAPTPRDPNGDGVYYCGSNPVGYVLVSGGENHEGAALLASCERFKILDPTVVDIDRKQLEETYLWTDEMLEMYDICYGIAAANPIIYYSGDLQDSLDGVIDSLSNGIPFTKNPSTWGQLKEQYRDTLDYYLEELNDMISDYLA